MAVDEGDLDLWQVAVPSDGVNYVTNPSAEVNTTGWATTSATLTRAVAGAFGGYAFRLLASAQNGKIAYSFSDPGFGVAIVVSAYVKTTSALVKLRVSQTNGGGTTNDDQAHPGDGEWHRLSVATTILSGTSSRTIEVVDTRTSAWANVDVDAVQLEYDPTGLTSMTAPTTYIDGDQEGCVWTAGEHASSSERIARDSPGGTLTSLETTGLRITGIVGAGAPGFQPDMLSSAVADWRTYQGRARSRDRILALRGVIKGTSLDNFHDRRRAIFALFNPDLRNNRGLMTLRYKQPDGLAKICKVAYEAGLEFNTMAGRHEEVVLRFNAPEPVWNSEAGGAASYLTNTTLGGVNYLMAQDREGAWSSLGGGISASVGGIVYALCEGRDGTVYAGGRWTGGSPSNTSAWLAYYRNGVWNKANTNPNEEVDAIVERADGNLLVVGWFTSPGGGVALLDATAGTWTTPYGSITGTVGPSNATIDALNTPWVVGVGQTGVSTNKPVAYYWTGAAWSYPGGLGTTNGTAYCVVQGPDGYVYVGTDFGVYRSLSYGTFFSVAATNGAVRDIVFGLDKRMYVGGDFTTIASVSANHVARLNGSVWEPLGTGVTRGGASTAGVVNSLAVGKDGEIYAVGGGTFYAAGDATWVSIGGVWVPFSGGVWHGSSWSAIDIIPPQNNGPPVYEVASRIIARRGGGIIFGFTSTGTATIPSQTTVTNEGTADAYPVFKVSGSSLAYSIVNYTTKQRISFSSLAFYSNPLIVDLRPGKKRVYSPWRDELPRVTADSDLDSFRLAPGANVIAFFGDVAVTGAVYWQNRYWSID